MRFSRQLKRWANDRLFTAVLTLVCCRTLLFGPVISLARGGGSVRQAVPTTDAVAAVVPLIG